MSLGLSNAKTTVERELQKLLWHCHLVFMFGFTPHLLLPNNRQTESATTHTYTPTHIDTERHQQPTPATEGWWENIFHTDDTITESFHTPVIHYTAFLRTCASFCVCVCALAFTSISVLAGCMYCMCLERLRFSQISIWWAPRPPWQRKGTWTGKGDREDTSQSFRTSQCWLWGMFFSDGTPQNILFPPSVIKRNQH